MKLVFWNGKKDLHSLIFLLVFIAFLISPLSGKLPKGAATYFQTVFQGDGTTLNGYKIYTGNDYIYRHHEFLGGVTVQKVSSGFQGFDWSYSLSFDEGTSREIGNVASICESPKSKCETITFDNFIGVNTATYIEVINKIYNRTVYYNPNCDVFVSHTGNPFDQIYLNMVKRFFNDNCQQSNS